MVIRLEEDEEDEEEEGRMYIFGGYYGSVEPEVSEVKDGAVEGDSRFAALEA